MNPNPKERLDVESVFAAFEPKAFPHNFDVTLAVDVIAGGTPTNPDVAKAWIRSRAVDSAKMKDALIIDEVARIMEERGITDESEALDEAVKNRHLTGFKRDAEKGLYIDGRQLKAMLKEAASVAADEGKLKPRGFGEVNKKKGVISFVAEHVFVPERRVYLGTSEPTEVVQSFVHTFRGSGIQYVETVHNCELCFSVTTDHDFTEEDWAMIWLTAQHQGIGACRSQGYGTFVVTRWEKRSNRGGLKAAA